MAGVVRFGGAAVAVAALLCAPAASAHDGGDTTLGPPRAAAAVASSAPAAIGRFSAPFEEPTIGGEFTGARCITDRNNVTICKPAAGSVSVLANGKVLYW